MANKSNWQKTFENLIRTETVINLCGNITDKFCSFNERSYVSVREYINDVLKNEGFQNIIFYNPVTGIEPGGTPANRPQSEKDVRSIATLAKEFCNNIQNSTSPVVWIIEEASYLCADTHHLNQEALNSYIKIRSAIDKGSKYNRVIFLYENEADAPRCFADKKNLFIPKPDQKQRKDFIVHHFSHFNNKDSESIADITDGLTLSKLEDIFNDVRSYAQQPDRNTVKNAISKYISGYESDPWTNIDKEKVDNLEERLNDRVRGQRDPIHTIAKKVIAAYSGVANIINGSYAPKAALVFAGETGVGKTETAKALATELFGTEDAIIRIDANEYREEFNCERIIGAPPGYVGYEAGGQLTNAVKEKPFSIILVDEVEKAHPIFWQYFMTVIQDGRLTSGKGETVAFNNCFIIFTTNLGALEASQCETNEEKNEVIYKAIEKYFISINRKEIFGRFKRNIITFNNISDEIAKEIVEKSLNVICENYFTENQIKINFSNEVIEYLKDAVGKSSEYGGRDVKNSLNDYISQALVSIHCNNNLVPGTIINIKSIIEKPDGTIEFIHDFDRFEVAQTTQHSNSHSPLVSGNRVITNSTQVRTGRRRPASVTTQ